MVKLSNQCHSLRKPISGAFLYQEYLDYVLTYRIVCVCAVTMGDMRTWGKKFSISTSLERYQ